MLGVGFGARGTRSDSVSIALWRLPYASGLSGPISGACGAGATTGSGSRTHPRLRSPYRARGTQTRPAKSVAVMASANGADETRSCAHSKIAIAGREAGVPLGVFWAGCGLANPNPKRLNGRERARISLFIRNKVSCRPSQAVRRYLKARRHTRRHVGTRWGAQLALPRDPDDSGNCSKTDFLYPPPQILGLL